MNWDALIEPLARLCLGAPRRAEPLRRHTTLRVGGPAALFYKTHDLEEFARISIWAHQNGIPVFIMGHGSNILVSDRGVPALVIYNACRQIRVGAETYAETGVAFQELFLKTAQAGLSGLEFAVGIPGTLGGALVSNAGAYRSNIADLLLEIDLVSEGVRQRVPPDRLRGFAAAADNTGVWGQWRNGCRLRGKGDRDGVQAGAALERRSCRRAK